MLNKFFQENVYQLRERQFDKLGSIKIHYSNNQELFDNVAKLDFQSICVQEDKFLNTDTDTRIDKHVPISVAILSDLIEQPIF